MLRSKRIVAAFLAGLLCWLSIMQPLAIYASTLGQEDVSVAGSPDSAGEPADGSESPSGDNGNSAPNDQGSSDADDSTDRKSVV